MQMEAYGWKGRKSIVPFVSISMWYPVFQSLSTRGRSLTPLEERFSSRDTESVATQTGYRMEYLAAGEGYALFPCIPGIAPCTIEITSG